MRQQKIEHRRKAPRLPPILEIDEDGIAVSEMRIPPLRRWAEDDEDALELGDWPTQLDN